MADQQISDLGVLTGANLAAGDKFEVLDVSDTSMAAEGTNKGMTAAELGAGLIRVGGVASATRVGCTVYRSAALNFAASSDTDVQWDAEDFDTDGFHSLVTDTDRITIPSGLDGLYLFTSAASSSTNGTASARWIHSIMKNTSTLRGSVVEILQNTTGPPQTVVTTITPAVAGDYFRTRVFNGAAATKAVNGGNSGFSCVRLCA